MKKEGGGGCRPQYCSAPKTALTGKTFFILFSTTNKMLLLDFCTLDRRGGVSQSQYCVAPKTALPGETYFFFYHQLNFNRTRLRVTWRVSYKKQVNLTLHENLGSPPMI